MDRTDFAIVEALQNDAWLSNKELASRVELAPSSCLQRVRALKKAGVLRGAHVDVAPEALGIGLQALIAVRLVKHSRGAFKTLYAYLSGLPEVLAVFHVSGVSDLQVHAALRDMRHLQDLIVDGFATRKEVARCATSVIFGFHRNPKLPCYVAPTGAKAAAARRPPKARARVR